MQANAIRPVIAAFLSAAAIALSPESSRAQALASDPLEAKVMAVDPLRAAATADPVLAKVDGVEIRESDLAIAEEALSRGLPTKDENIRRQNLIKYLTDVAVLSNAAKQRNIADEADKQRIERRVEFTRNQALMEKLLQITGSGAITGEALRKAYDEAVQKNGTEPEYHLRTMVFLFKDVHDEAAVAAAEAKAEAAYRRVRTGEDFVAVAKDVSENPGAKENGGDLGYMTRAMMGKELAEVAFTLDNGGVSKPIKTQFAWHLLKVEDKRNRKPVEFEAVRDKLRVVVARRAQLQLISELRSQAKIELLDKGDQAQTEATKQP